MICYYIGVVEEDGIRYAESRLVWQIGRNGREHCISKRRMAIGTANPDRTAKRELWMKVDIALPMTANETVEAAQDRMLDLADSVGIRVVGWNDRDTDVWEDDGK